MEEQKKLTGIISENKSNQRLDQALVRVFPKYSRSRIKKWILDQRILVNNVIWNKPKKKYQVERM